MSYLAILASGNTGGGGEDPFVPVEPVSTQGAGWNFNDPPAGAAITHHDRALSWYFDNEDVVISWGDAWNSSNVANTDIVSWDVRDYEGTVVMQGTNIESPLNLGRPGVGWYKLYFHRSGPVDQRYGDSGGETTFIVSRTGAGLRDTPLPVAEEGGGWVSSANRSYIGSGMVRLDVDLRDADRAAWRASLDQAKADAAVALANLDLQEPGSGQRHVFIQFPDNEATGGTQPTPEQEYQITTTVQEMCAMGVTHFEGRNEPVTKGIIGSTSAAEYAAFAPIVHAADPNAKVVGPCPVNINPSQDGLQWVEDFFAAGGGDHIDVFSFHTYNATNNDINQGRRVYGGLIDLLTRYGQQNKPRWITEYGHYAHMYGSSEIRWQAQVIMTEIQLAWQHGVHRSNFMYYYDFSVGYWDQPMWLWSSNRGRKVPTALPLMWRTMVEETWGMDMVGPLDFGTETRHYLGSRLQAADGSQCLWIQGSGRVGTVTATVTGATSIEVADYFGRPTTVNVVNGQIEFPVGTEPCYVRIPVGVTVDIVPVDYGTDVTPLATVTAWGKTGGNGPERAIDGKLQNEYERTGDSVWKATIGDSAPSWWKAEFGQSVTFDTVEILCPPPWQHSGSLLDFDVQVYNNGTWTTIHSEAHYPVSVQWTSDKAVSGCFVDSFWDRRRIFVARLPEPVTGTAIRIWARNYSFGGGATIDQYRTWRVTDENGLPKILGQSGPQRLTIQEVALYNSGV